MVEGSTGEYSDHCEWPVCAYTNKTKAETRVVEAQARANELFAGEGSYPYKLDGVNEFDSNMRMDYTGVEYQTYEVELDPIDDRKVI